MPNNHEPHFCYLIDREERAAESSRRYQDYVQRFNRHAKLKGWLRFLAKRPWDAFKTLVRREPLPTHWMPQPLDEDEYITEKAIAFMKMMTPPD